MKWRIFFYFQLISAFLAGGLLVYLKAEAADFNHLWWEIITLSAIIYFGEILEKKL